MIAGHWNVVVAGARIAGAATAWALAPYAERVLVVDASRADAFWPQQSSWDRDGNVAWSRLGLLETVLSCGAPPTYGHTFRTDEGTVEHDYPTDIDLSYRMCVPRHVLDPALMAAVAKHDNVTVVRPARLADIAMSAGQVRGAVVRHGGADHAVTCDLLVIAEGRLSRNADRLGAVYRTVASPWFAMLAYFADLRLPADRGYFSLRDGSILIGTPCGDREWCISAGAHQKAIDIDGGAERTFARLVAEDPLLAPAVDAGRRISPLGRAGRLRMLRRPMSGPGWCLVGDAGYHLDPVTAYGTRAALITARVLRDRVAAIGGVDRTTMAGGALDGLTAERDAALETYWSQTEGLLS